MDQHKKTLSTLCRLCGSTLKPGAKGSQSKWPLERTIQNVLNIAIKDDTDEVHPPTVCTACRLKLSRFQKKKRKSKDESVPGIQIKLFSPHSEDCSVCELEEWDMDFIKTLCASNGYMSWVKREKCMAVIVDDFGERILKRIVFSQKSWEVFVMGKKFQNNVECKFQNIEQLLTSVSSGIVCSGNYGFVEANQSYSNKEIAFVESQYFDGNDLVQEQTIHHKNCLLMFNDKEGKLNLCKVCRQFRCDVSATNSRLKAAAASTGATSKYTRSDYLPTEQLREKVKSLVKEKKGLIQKQDAIQKSMKKLMDEECIGIESKEDNEKLTSILSNCDIEFEKAMPVDSRRYLLWQQQKQVIQSKSKTQMRWHPDIIRWAIAIKSKSTSAYKLLRDSGFLYLPHPSTLYTYTHFTQLQSGLNADLLKKIYDEAKVKEMSDHQKMVSVLFDEMKVTSGLVFSRSTGKLVGFTEVGDVDLEMNAFERRFSSMHDKDSSRKPRLASHVLLFMIRGVTSNLKYPVAYFPTQNVTSHQLYPLVWKVIEGLKLIGLTVKSLVSDGASSNRKLYELLAGRKPIDSTTPDYKTQNSYEEDESCLYFFCDVPHLMKTTRNNFENSNWNRKTRRLIYNKKEIKWNQVLDLYEQDQRLNAATPGLRLLPKLRHEHFHLTPSLRMKVSLAAQVLSSSVANALEMLNKPELSSTIEFIRKMNKFFDVLNVTSMNQWARSRNENLKPFSSLDDPRFKWLEDDFLGFWKSWQEEINAVPGLSKSEQQKMCLSRATTTGFYITVHSFIGLAKEMLQMEGVNYLLSDKFNQDPAEEFFSKQRGAGGSHDNPTVEQFRHHMLSNIAAGSSARASSRANVRTSSENIEVSEEPLPKKRRSQNK